MKFLKSEYDDLQAVIKQNNCDPKVFHQVKRKGHLYIHQDGREDAFCFFRKKETVLNAQHQWEDKTTYFIGPKNSISCECWEEVVKAFENWLKKSL
ncbi:MAG: hypothetical protein HUJ25_11665 [Crocinitomicaceae bacterium]|nr:hypothetical protein [Crocinitomicaceae bacterium]